MSSVFLVVLFTVISNPALTAGQLISGQVRLEATTILPYLIDFPIVPNYQSGQGDCIFDLTINVTLGETLNLRQCSMACDVLELCQGFVHDVSINTCQLKSSTESCQAFPFEPTKVYYIKDNSIYQPVNENGQSPSSFSCQSNAGKVFYVAFMANRPEQPKSPPMELWVTQDEKLLGELAIHVDTKLANRETIQVGYREIRKIEFSADTFRMTDVGLNVTKNDAYGGIIIEPKVIRVSTPENITFVMYGVNKEYYTADAFLSYPKDGLGNRYYASCHWPPTYQCAILVASTNDLENTVVSIRLPKLGAVKSKVNLTSTPARSCYIEWEGRIYDYGDVIELTLKPWDAAELQAACDLTGTYIEANHLVAVWSGNVRSAVGEGMDTRDILTEQLPPINQWGTECAAFPTPNRTIGDFWTVTASHNNTQIFVDKWYPETMIDGNRVAPKTYDQESYILNAGESWRFISHTPAEWMKFFSSKPFMAVSYIHSQTRSDEPADPSMTVCIPTSQFPSGSTPGDTFGYTFITPEGVATNYTNFISIVLEKGREEGLKIEGLPLTTDNGVDIEWRSVPNSTLIGGSFAFYPQRENAQEFRLEHSNGNTPFSAYVYSAGDRESTAYAVGACTTPTTECVRTVEFVVAGDKIDNDCDGLVDEEIRNGIDDDGDGEIDEDYFVTKERIAALIKIIPLPEPFTTTTSTSPATIKSSVTMTVGSTSSTTLKPQQDTCSKGICLQTLVN